MGCLSGNDLYEMVSGKKLDKGKWGKIGKGNGFLDIHDDGFGAVGGAFLLF